MENNGPPDLIFLGMNLQGEIDDWQFLKARDAEWYAVPVLIVTALGIACDEWAESLGRAGCHTLTAGSFH
jgi:hypothetical protein